MDPITHALTSYTLKRAAFPRANRRLTIAIVLAGSVTSLDSLSAHISPSAYLSYYRNASSSFFLAFLLAIAFSIPFFLQKPSTEKSPLSPAKSFLAILVSALLHPLMDVLQAEPTALLWPFSPQRFELDWLPHVDLWIFTLLLAALLLPKLFSLISDEIGAKSKRPGGQAAAMVALSLLLSYVGLRALMHSTAISAIDARTYRGESAGRTAVLPDANSPFTWQGVFETNIALHDVPVVVGPLAQYDPEMASNSFKPDPSPALLAASQTPSAKRFLAIARFPKAAVEQLPTGYIVTIRDFPPHRESRSALRVQAVIELDSSGQIRSNEITWDPSSQGKSDR